MAFLATFGSIRETGYEKLFDQVFRLADHGALRVTWPSGEVRSYQGTQPGPAVDMHIHDWAVLKQALLRGDIGFGETYIDGLWTTSDLAALMTYMVYNLEDIGKVVHAHPIMRRVFQGVNWLRRNTKENSRENIRAHYDVGNAFYALWLDETMTYSSALYQGSTACSLAEAQRRKYARILSKIPAPGDVLEIGCGWGGFAEEAVKKNHQLVGLTLSHEQHAFATQRLQKNHPQATADFRLQDYRDVKGTFDAIVSIEMLEAVGEQYWPIYFRTVRERLKSQGVAIIQTITIDHDYFDDYKRRSDFIRHYTFPGGLLPSIPRLQEEIRAAGLVLKEVHAFGLDYARTLTEWLDTLNAKRETVLALGYDEAFMRSWQFYLACCIGAFRVGRTNVVQLELVRA
jgi:cyclopropane-fatty-acyl-phospholipid synthase